jgi:hypothetical protein
MNAPPSFLLAAQASQLPPWALPAAGGTAVLLLLIYGFSVLGRRRGPRQAPPRRSVLNFPRENTSRDGQGEERRCWPRRGGNPTAVLIQARSETWEGMVVDRSQGGLCLLMDLEPAKGTVLKVRVAKAPEHVPAVEVKTIWSRPVGDRWHIGCQFVSQPPLNVLLFFG